MPAGATVALVGPSGAGKTTIANLLLRFWDPEQGAIRLDGVDLRELPLDGLRGRIALVAQDTYLFNDTLEANVRLARPDATARRDRRALRQAALAEFVAGLPEGLATRVGERGVQLSGGQRQRIAIARAFLKDAPMLVLDEATSHLDTISESAVRARARRADARSHDDRGGAPAVDHPRRRPDRGAGRRAGRGGGRPRRATGAARRLRAAGGTADGGGRLTGGPRCCYASLPPSTAMIWPVMNDALSEATNTMAWAISSGVPARLSGTPRDQAGLAFGGAGEPVQHLGLDRTRARPR